MPLDPTCQGPAPSFLFLLQNGLHAQGLETLCPPLSQCEMVIWQRRESSQPNFGVMGCGHLFWGNKELQAHQKTLVQAAGQVGLELFSFLLAKDSSWRTWLHNPSSLHCHEEWWQMQREHVLSVKIKTLGRKKETLSMSEVSTPRLWNRRGLDMAILERGRASVPWSEAGKAWWS